MYDFSVPVYLHPQFDRERTLQILQKMGARRVFLALDILSFRKDVRAEQLSSLSELIPYFKAGGLEVGVWFWTFWRKDLAFAPAGSLKITGFDGSTSDKKGDDLAFFCPASASFVEDTCDFLKQVAKLGPDLIQFDDDFRFGNLPTGFGCCCDNHLTDVSRRIGENVDRIGLAEKAFSGGENKYRYALLDSWGESLESFAAALRRAVDMVNPAIRLSPCACLSVWDLDGTDAAKLARILAGNTKPIMRLIGAPYWAVKQSFTQRLQGVVELERMERSWCGEGIEIMAEGDTFPRPRHRCPASFLEGFDTAIRASGATDGILKYALSYSSAPDYEPGYVNMHLKNMQLYQEIDRFFSNKADCGLRIYEVKNKIRGYDLPVPYAGEKFIQNLFHSPAAKFCADNSFPTSYTAENSVGVVFGENAKYLPHSALERGLILDIKAATILKNKGFDVGLTSVGAALESVPYLFSPAGEKAESNYVSGVSYEMSLSPHAEVLSFSGEEGPTYPDAYFYENSKGQRFLVFAFDAYLVSTERFRNYFTQNLVARTLPRLGAVPPLCLGNPDLYLLCRESENEMALGLWNFFADPVDEPTISLPFAPIDWEFIGCSGTVDGRSLRLSPIAPFAQAFVRLQKGSSSRNEESPV